MQMRLWIAAALLVVLTTAACGSSTATPTAAPDAAADTAFATVTPAPADAAAEVTPLPTVDATAVAEELAANVATAMELVQHPEGDVAATVNGEDIPTDRYLEFLNLRLNTVTSQYGLDWADEGNLSILRQLESQVLTQLVNNMLIQQVADRDGVTLNEDDVNNLNTQIMGEILASGQYADWDAFLAANGMSEETYQLIIEESVLLDSMMDIYAPVEDVEQVHAQHILVSDEATAEDLLQQIEDGADFGELATANSIDTGSAASGGDLGWFPRGIMVTAFEEAAFALEPDQVSGVVATDYGYHIIKVLGKEVRALDESLAEEAQNNAFLTWLDEQTAAAEIVILVPTQDSGTAEEVATPEGEATVTEDEAAPEATAEATDTAEAPATEATESATPAE